MNFKSKISFLSILGLIVPFGAMWIPYLVKTENESEQGFRKRFFFIQLALFIVCMIIGAVGWSKEISSLENSGVLSGANIYMLSYAIALPLVSLGIGIYHLTRPQTSEEVA